MAGRVQARAGWGGESLRNASPSLQHRYAAVDAQERQEAARAERERQMLLEQRQADDIALSVRMAEQPGSC